MSLTAKRIFINKISEDGTIGELSETITDEFGNKETRGSGQFYELVGPNENIYEYPKTEYFASYEAHDFKVIYWKRIK